MGGTLASLSNVNLSLYFARSQHIAPPHQLAQEGRIREELVVEARERVDVRLGVARLVDGTEHHGLRKVQLEHVALAVLGQAFHLAPIDCQRLLVERTRIRHAQDGQRREHRTFEKLPRSGDDNAFLHAIQPPWLSLPVWPDVDDEEGMHAIPSGIIKS